MKKRLALQMLVIVAIIAFAASCATTPFSEKTSTRDGEITAFGEIVLDSEVALEDLENLGAVEVSRTVTYTLQQNGDYVIEMDDYTYSYTALDMATEISGTRVVGNLNYSTMAGGGELAIPMAGGAAGLLGGLLGGAAPAAGGTETSAASVAAMGPRQIAMDAVNYDLIQAAAAKGAMALLLPEYSWEIEEELTGTDTAGFLFLPPSRVYETKNMTYTVTARAVAVAF